MDATKLIAWLPFNESVTQDFCGNTWTTNGSPAIENGKLVLNGSSYLTMTEKFAFTGKPFTISCKFSCMSNTTGGSVCLWQMHIGDSNRIQISISTSGKFELWKDSDSTINIISAASILNGQIHHAECDFDGATWYLFLDGNLIGSKVHTCSARNYTLYVGTNYQKGRKFTGTIDEFQIYDGVALHTENFTPPTDEYYADLKNVLEDSATFVYIVDVETKYRTSPKNDTDNAYIALTGGNYATLPEGILPDATEFTIEAKFSTTSTAKNSTYFNQPTIIGRDVSLYHNNSWSLCVNDGKLCFWAEPKVGDPYNLTTEAIVNDGEIHKVAVRSNADGSLDLLCDGEIVAHKDNANVKLPDYTIGVGYSLTTATRLDMNLHEAQFWNTARTTEEIFSDVAGDEENLEAWYIPTEKGLLDYSSNMRTATITGTTTYMELETVFVDVEYESSNDALAWRYEDCAVYFGTGAPINFHVPKAYELWIRFDVYFDGEARWYAYDDGIYGMTGITALTTLELDYLSAGATIKTLPDVCKSKQTQTFLLHMISGATFHVAFGRQRHFLHRANHLEHAP